MSQQQPQPPDPGYGRRRALFWLGVAAFLGVIWLLGEVSGGDQPPRGSTARVRTTTATTASAEREPDASAQVSCEHFRNVMGDVAQGILSDAELRDKLKEVHSSASVSEEPGVASAATAMLAAVTTGTPTELLEAAGDFDRACDRAGL